MSKKYKYPKINLRSKSEIAKRISSKSLNQKSALNLINFVIKNFDNCWYDSKRSEPEKGKYVRSAAKSRELKILLKLINEKILAPYDYLVPDFVFGGLSERNNIKAARYLIGKKKQRILLKLDIKSFFEQISSRRVFYFFYKHAGCSVEVANILASICCVPKGVKGSKSNELIIARGFATSSRLAMWTNLGTFQMLYWKIIKKLKNADPKVAIYVDDIGITASRIEKNQMEDIKSLVIDILEKHDENQPLPTHRDGNKLIIKNFRDGAEHLGIKLGRNKLSLGRKARSKTDILKFVLKTTVDKEAKQSIKEKYLAHHRYKRQVEKS